MSKKKSSDIKRILALVILIVTLALYQKYVGLIPATFPPESDQATSTVLSISEGDIVAYFTNIGNEAFPNGVETHLISLIDNAKDSIDVAVFELDLENVTDALVSAHQRGVVVRVVHDNEHTEDDGMVARLIAEGIPAVADERTAFMHNKFFVIDGSVVWTGSWNVTANGSYKNNNNVVVFFSEEIAHNYAVEFNEMFNGQFGPTSPVNTPNKYVDISGHRVATYFAPEEDVFGGVNTMIYSASESVHFMAFSFTEDTLAMAMLGQAERGIEVSGLFETRGANTDYSECNRLLGAGLDVRLDSNPATMHHKVIIIDGRTVITGSFNFSASANQKNDENLLIINDKELASLYEAEFEKLMNEAYVPVGTCSR
jgi:phosphatidylserine/phosphatidylglycerophosphate/cardiolipin synthase-like enzyme